MMQFMKKCWKCSQVYEWKWMDGAPIPHVDEVFEQLVGEGWTSVLTVIEDSGGVSVFRFVMICPTCSFPSHADRPT